MDANQHTKLQRPGRMYFPCMTQAVRVQFYSRCCTKRRLAWAGISYAFFWYDHDKDLIKNKILSIVFAWHDSCYSGQPVNFTFHSLPPLSWRSNPAPRGVARSGTTFLSIAYSINISIIYELSWLSECVSLTVSIYSSLVVSLPDRKDVFIRCVNFESTR